jgi:hypothetical protein
MRFARSSGRVEVALCELGVEVDWSVSEMYGYGCCDRRRRRIVVRGAGKSIKGGMMPVGLVS